MKKVIIISLLSVYVFYFVDFLFTFSSLDFLYFLTLDSLQVCRNYFFIEFFHYFYSIFLNNLSSSGQGECFKYDQGLLNNFVKIFLLGVKNSFDFLEFFVKIHWNGRILVGQESIFIVLEMEFVSILWDTLKIIDDV